jgi:hypothetical protein
MTEVSLEPFDARWRDDVHALLADPEVLRFTRVPEPPPADFASTWIASYEQGSGAGRAPGPPRSMPAERSSAWAWLPTDPG